MKHLSHRTIAIIVALLSTLSLALAVISLPHQAYAVDGTDGTSGTNSTSQGSDGDSAPIAGPVPNIIVTNFTYGGDSVAAGADFNLDFTFQNMGQVAVTNMVITVDGGESFAIAGRHEHVLRRRAVGRLRHDAKRADAGARLREKRCPARDRELPIRVCGRQRPLLKPVRCQDFRADQSA